MSIEQNIEEWLKNKGFPFEISCARTLRNHGFSVQPSIHYLDDEIQNYREIDLCAFKSFQIGDFAFNITLIIECKSSDTPWIVFVDPMQFPAEALLSNLVVNINGEQLLSKIDRNDKNTFSFSVSDGEFMAYNFVQMRKNTNDKDKDHAYEALLQSGKCTLSLKKHADKSELKFCNLYIPVVIVHDKLYKVTGAEKEDSMKVEEINFCKHRRIFSFGERPFQIHHLVSGSHLDEYCKVVSQDIDYFFKKYQKEIEHISKTRPSNSSKGHYVFGTV